MTSDAFPPAPTEDRRLGMVLQDKYRIVRKIGEGGMGSVYEAEHVLIKRRVAIKCLHAHFTSNQELVARFHREAQAATAIGNEHIIEVTDMGALPDALFVIDVGYHKIAVAEAKKLGIPVIGVVDTNHSPEGIDYVIPGNDDSAKAVALYARGMADAIIDGRENAVNDVARAAAGEGASDDEFVEVEDTAA